MLTRPDGSALLVNPDRIETVEQTPDTVITMADGKKLLVRETAETVAELFLMYHRAVHLRTEGQAPLDLAEGLAGFGSATPSVMAEAHEAGAP
jgi:flagellar protein FlbD